MLPIESIRIEVHMSVYLLDKSPKRDSSAFSQISLVELNLKLWKERRTKKTLIKSITALEEN